MAGESPGRAERQESSGEATGRRAADPRLAVFHEVEGAGESPGSSDADYNDSVADRGARSEKSSESSSAGGSERPEEGENESRISAAQDDVADVDAAPVDDAADAADTADAADAADEAPQAEPEAAEGPLDDVAGEAAAEAPGDAGEAAEAEEAEDGDDADESNGEAAEGEGENGEGENGEEAEGGDDAEAEPDEAAGEERAAPPREGTLVLTARSVAQARANLAPPEAKPLPAKPAATPAGPAGRTTGTFVPLVTDEPPSAPRESTKQMPLPPVPGEPLKLLAELTNTPSPPETALRTLARRFKIWTPLVLLLAVILGTVQALRPLPDPQLTLTSASSYTFKGSKPSLPWPSEGQAVVEVEGLGILGSYGEEKAVPIASVAKVMTAYVILRDHPVKSGGKGESITVDKKAADQYTSGLAGDESVVKVAKGQKLSEYEALEAVLLASANNVARLLARWDAGSEEAFVKKMNAAAEELGMTNTTYTDPSGLEATTVSTAKDQVKLGKKAMQSSEVFQEIATKIEYTDSDGTRHKNWNQLAGYNGVVGIKTGTSTKAGGNLLFAATKTVGGAKRLIIGATLGQYAPPIITTVLNKSKELILATQGALTSDVIVKKGDIVGYVDDGLGGRTAVIATKDVTAVGWSGLKVSISLAPPASGIPHEAKAGTAVGTLTVGNGDSHVKVPVALRSDLAEPSLGTKLTRVA